VHIVFAHFNVYIRWNPVYGFALCSLNFYGYFRRIDPHMGDGNRAIQDVPPESKTAEVLKGSKAPSAADGLLLSRIAVRSSFPRVSDSVRLSVIANVLDTAVHQARQNCHRTAAG
jgi:hypothetical protein